MKRIGIIMAATMAAAILFTGCGSASAGRSADEVNNGVYSNGISCHDPQIILADDGNYYMTGSHQVLARSADLKSWDYIVNGDNMFSNIFDGDKPAFAYVGQNEEGGYSIWASNIFYNETMKKYVMYFCTTSTYIKSNLCMAVSDKPEGPYEYTDTLVYSGFTKKEAEQTNIYEVLGADADISRYIKHGGFNNKEYPNCIDPALFTDKDGKIWMTYGSWSGGIFILEIDPATGLPIFPKDDPAADPYYGYHLIGGEH
ncbi:MAG: arabinan endo-1,5-alpha-L-arabinosidase, partial [Lachnospiraceae bacterium]|nr:arabinan endo-1,5-alpha-L-arabinosidase [Lachnospiraceae bacterium]